MTSPVQRVLAVTRRHGLRSLLMGGQACVLYGASEFSRDVDLAILADPAYLRRLDGVHKDWPMVRRLVDVHYRAFRDEPTAERIDFWLRESRTPETLLDCVQRAPDAASRVASIRAPVAAALSSADDDTHAAITAALVAEEHAEREADERYWRPLLDELELLRREARRSAMSAHVNDLDTKEQTGRAEGRRES